MEQTSALLHQIKTNNSFFCPLKVQSEVSLQTKSIFDNTERPLKMSILALVDATTTTATPSEETGLGLGHYKPLRRALGSMVGMAIADSLGHNFEFLPARDCPSCTLPASNLASESAPSNKDEAKPTSSFFQVNENHACVLISSLFGLLSFLNMCCFVCGLRFVVWLHCASL